LVAISVVAKILILGEVVAAVADLAAAMVGA
jgi:hypothetical protein